MTAITATPAIARPTGFAFWYTAVALVAAILALTVWTVANTTSRTGGGTSSGQRVQTSQNGNQLCAPAPGTRYC